MVEQKTRVANIGQGEAAGEWGLVRQGNVEREDQGEKKKLCSSESESYRVKKQTS